MSYHELHDACCEYVREVSSVLAADDEPRGWDVLQNFDDLQAIAQRAFDSAFKAVDTEENEDCDTKRADFAARSKIKRKRNAKHSSNDISSSSTFHTLLNVSPSLRS